MMKRLIVTLGILLVAAPAYAQLGGLKGIAKTVDKGVKAYDDFNFTPEEEKQLGSDISARLREKYGVVQDKAVHKYVTLVGTAVGVNSSRPNATWTFIVLDTDGVNAFAAPGGFVHITRGALALIQNEAELADVLGHEISHVTFQHTINAIKKSKGVSAGTQALAAKTRQDFLKEIGDRAYAMTVENIYDSGDEKDADKNGVILASKTGYAPTELAVFLKNLAERNKDLKERSGPFASYPETQARIDGLGKVISSEHLATKATVAARYKEAITYKPVPVSQIAQVAPPTPGAAAPPAEQKSSGSGKLGVSGLTSLGKDKSSSSTISSAGSRGVNPDRDAKGGPNKALVVVTITAAELSAFTKGITG
jgi:predicted Zn-dependent protease